MEIGKVREALVPLALDHPTNKPDPAIQAIALLHIAEGIEDLRRRQPVKADYP
jgi:hypothetical protein